MEIYTEYGPALLRKCERMLRSRQDAEDIVQSLFMDLLKKGDTDVDLPYLYRASTNRCLNLLRNRKKQRSLLQQQDNTLMTPIRTFLDDRIVDKDLLVKLVNKLDRKSSEILVYCYFDDLGQEEIAKLMNLSRKTVGKRLKKIKDKARRISAYEKGAFR